MRRDLTEMSGELVKTRFGRRERNLLLQNDVEQRCKTWFAFPHRRRAVGAENLSEVRVAGRKLTTCKFEFSVRKPFDHRVSFHLTQGVSGVRSRRPIEAKMPCLLAKNEPESDGGILHEPTENITNSLYINGFHRVKQLWTGSFAP